MRKSLKIMMSVFIILGITFSILNFVSIKTEALFGRGAWVIVNGNWQCGGDGAECNLFFPEPPY